MRQLCNLFLVFLILVWFILAGVAIDLCISSAVSIPGPALSLVETSLGRKQIRQL